MILDTSVQITILVILLFLSAFFSMSETALMSLSKIRVRHMVEEGVKGAKLVEKLIEDPNKLLGAILIGNNRVNIGASSLATSIAVAKWGEGGVGIVTLGLTVIVLIFGEITPKSIAKQKSESVSLAVSKFINIVVKVLKPFIILFTGVASIFIRLLGGDPKANEPFITEEEIKTMVGVSEEEGVLEDVEKEMIFNVFDFADAQVKDVMVQNQVGLHARPATFFIQKANEYKSSVWVEKEERRVNAKSLLGVLSLGIVGGTSIRIIADGSDEEAAVNGLVALVESGFAE